MLDNAKEINQRDYKKFKESFDKERVNKILQNAANKNKLSTLAFVGTSKVGNYDNFSIDIKTLPATAQKQSGRCWIFAATNVLREVVANKLNLADFELSQNYVAFYDKLEKVNYMLESVIDLLDKKKDDRTLQHVVMWGVGDGGQWDMFKSLVKKYGLVPKNVMDETASSSGTNESNFVINRLIRKFSAKAYKLHQEGKDNQISKLKDEVLNQAYKILSIAFGTPVEEFDFEYVDKDGVYHLDRGLNPKKFYQKYIGLNLDDYVSVINAPTEDKPYYQTFTVDYIGNVIGGNPICYLNLPQEELKELVVKQLKAGEVVWFGSDCGKYGQRDEGFWAPEQYDYNSLFNIDLEMDKADMLDFREAAMNHAMVITGVNLVDDKPTKWKIENSWGKDIAHAGYFTATDLWFDNFVFQAVVNVKYLNEKQQKALAKKPKHLNPWDPMGTLAD